MPVNADRLLQAFASDDPLDPPKTAYVNVVRRCNAGCKYCLDWTAPRDSRLDPSREKLNAIFAALLDLGVEDIVMSGGEPFLRRDLAELISDARGLGFGVRLITNGTLVTPRQISAILDLGVSRVGVSIDSLSPAKMMQIRGLPLHRVISTIETLAEARRDTPELAISLMVTVTRLNIEDLLPIAEYATALGVQAQYQPVHYAGTGLEDEILEVLWPKPAEIAQLSEVIDVLIEHKRAGTAAIRSGIDFLERMPEFFRNRTYRPRRCTVAHTDIVIDQDLKLRPCWSMSPVGSLVDPSIDLPRLWLSDDMRRVRSEIREGRCPGCLYSCHIDKSHVQLK